MSSAFWRRVRRLAGSQGSRGAAIEQAHNLQTTGPNRNRRSEAKATTLLFEAIEQRILLSADHNPLAATLVPTASLAPAVQPPAAPVVDVAATTKATALDAFIKPSDATATVNATVPGSQIQQQTFSGTTAAGPDTFTIDNVAQGNTLAVLLNPSDPSFAGTLTLTDPSGNVVAQQDPYQPLAIDPVTADQAGDYTVTHPAGW